MTATLNQRGDTTLKQRFKRLLQGRPADTLSDQDAIARDAPELAGMTLAQGAEIILKEIDLFEAQHSPEQTNELFKRLRNTRHSSWKHEGRRMGWWGNLVVLRRFEAEIELGAA